jgi:ribosomal protein S6
VAAISYESALAMAESLSHEEQLRLIEELRARANEGAAHVPQHSIMELRGLGKEIWQGIDAQEYVNQERASWNG